MVKALMGAHFSYKKDSQLLGTVKDAVSIGATSGSFYISNSRGYSKHILDIENIKEAKKFSKDNNFDLENFIVHSPLVGNIANIDVESGIYEKTIKSYLSDLNSLELSGIKYFNFHPGSSPDYQKGIEQIAKGINYLHKNTKGDNTVILLETMMKKGNYIGKNFEELKDIIDLVNDKKRIGICMDTCHVWDAGYDIKNNLNYVMNKFNKIIGLEYLKAAHINDSKNERGSNKDRHESIGFGHIGEKALKEFVNHKDIIKLPKALETPKGKKNYRLWKEEIILLT